MLIFLISCGNRHSGENSTLSGKENLLTQEDQVLVGKLLEKKVWQQRDLLKAIVISKGVSDKILQKLDLRIKINCEDRGSNCLLTPREIP